MSERRNRRPLWWSSGGPPSPRHGRGAWFEDFTDSAAIGRDLQQAVSAFIEAMGTRPSVFRFGAGWLDQPVVHLLDKAGFAFDLSIPPGQPAKPAAAPDIGAYPDFGAVPREPYRPDRRDFRRLGRWPFARRLWMLPIATSCAFHPGEWHPGAEEGHGTDQLNLRVESRAQPALDALLRAQAPVIVAVGRTGDLSRLEAADAFRANLNYLCHHPAMGRVAIEPPAAAIKRYTQRQ
jgi:hypothetical protein